MVISGTLLTGENPVIAPEDGSGISARHIVIYVNGINGTDGQIASTPKAVEVGVRQDLRANIYAPNGTIWIKARGTAEGAFIGRDVMVDYYAQFTLNSAF